jgi:hypothetical protein
MRFPPATDLEHKTDHFETKHNSFAMASGQPRSEGAVRRALHGQRDGGPATAQARYLL